MGLIFCNSPYSPLLRQYCPLPVMFKKIIRQSHSNHSYLVTLTSESQAHTLSILIIVTGKPIPAQPYSSLHFFTGTISVSELIALFTTRISQTKNYLLVCLIDYDAVLVLCYTIPLEAAECTTPVLPKLLSVE